MVLSRHTFEEHALHSEKSGLNWVKPLRQCWMPSTGSASNQLVKDRNLECQEHTLDVITFIKNNHIDLLLISETHFASRNYLKISYFTVYDTNPKVELVDNK